ncbi:MAG: hypothetical protein QME69_04105 [Candidatus Saccharicenans sp.]|nr:hypothetical protein [Candidatus Saccharicenans sp.]
MVSVLSAAESEESESGAPQAPQKPWVSLTLAPHLGHLGIMVLRFRRDYKNLQKVPPPEDYQLYPCVIPLIK